MAITGISAQYAGQTRGGLGVVEGVWDGRDG